MNTALPDDASAAQRLDQICDRFEAEWSAGRRPEINNVLNQVPETERASLLCELMAVEVEWRRTHGETPTPTEYEDRFPEHSHIIVEIFRECKKKPKYASLETTINSAESTAGKGDAVDTPAGDNSISRFTDPELPANIGRYEVRAKLGSGGFGVVYLGYDNQLQRLVAIKAQRADRSRRTDDVHAYLGEAKVVANLDHPHIVPVYDVGQTDDGCCFIVSKLIEGEDLSKRIESHRPSHEESARLVATIAEALHYTHGQNLAHRDIKPANILIDSSGTPYVVDFGLVLQEQDMGKRAGYYGSPAYMSPEQARGEGHLVDGRSDIFSLGVVFYELLTGQRPFTGANWHDLVSRIKLVDPRPPQQLDETIPCELERICLKALSKRASDRYASAKDMADDLHDFLIVPNAGSVRDRSQPPLKIIPRGLRAFDDTDSNFFLQLLPGPRDRHGLPESVRFWKNHLEECDPEKTFRVGVIWGPSGCGKSSLVKAGLLPRLEKHVNPVYVESTSTDTETRISSLVRQHESSLPTALPELFCAIRQQVIPASKTKTVLVLDQFEQWLHAHNDPDDTDLVEAIRQCDGARLQCLILVRDDFSMALTRFMRAVEIPIVQGQNFDTVDLFPLRHATNVLSAFGRAFGEIPESEVESSPEHKKFLSDAVEQLAVDGKVVCLRLALFAEMMKHSAWIPSTLQEIGGVEGIGIKFLDETFSSQNAPPHHQIHRDAARAVLKTMLPTSKINMRGTTRTVDELRRASSYGDEESFDELIQILDGELRLITPTESVSNSRDNGNATGCSANQLRYQLTHDYLVPSLREWLTRKQRETWRGRAELCLEERVTEYQRSSEARFLPTPLEYAAIQFGVPRKKRNPQHRAVLHAATRRYGLIGLLVLIVTATASWGLWEINGRVKGEGIAQSIVTAEPSELNHLIHNRLTRFRRWAKPALIRVATNQDEDDQRRLHANVALMSFDRDRDRVDYLKQRLLECSVEVFPIIRDSLKPYQRELIDYLQDRLNSDRSDSRRFFAGLALAHYSPKSHQWTNDQIDFLARQLLDFNTDYQRDLRDCLEPISDRLLLPLRRDFRDSTLNDRLRESAANALADYAEGDARLLAKLVSGAAPQQYKILLPKLAAAWSKNDVASRALVSAVERQPTNDLTEKQRIFLGQQRADAAISLMRLGSLESAIDVFRFQDDPESMTQFIHRHRARGISAVDLIDCLDRVAKNQDEKIRFAMLLALGEFELTEIPEDRRESLIARLVGWYANDPSSAIHGAGGWLLRRWGFNDEAVNVDQTSVPYDATGKREWFVMQVADDYFTFVVFQSGEFIIGSPDFEQGRVAQYETSQMMQIERPFAMSDREVTRGQFERFRRHVPPNLRVKHPPYPNIDRYSPTDEHPMISPMWHESLSYCRWLTEQHPDMNETDHCYVESATKDRLGFSVLHFHPEHAGFRLPTEAEWEFACRSGTVTAYSFGNDQDLLDRYAWFEGNARPMITNIGGHLRPNPRGLFDMHGNVDEWCQDGFFDSYIHAKRLGPGAANRTLRAMRGGASNFPARYCRSATRRPFAPSAEAATFGFRLCMTVVGENRPEKP